MLRTASPAAIEGWNRRASYADMLSALQAERAKVEAAINALVKVDEMYAAPKLPATTA
jgi:hypothetical protein